jgi:uncharacterized protein (UPF0212 family)
MKGKVSVQGARKCPACGHEWDDDCIQWMIKRHGRYHCPYCATHLGEKVPANWFARRVA